MTIRGVLFDWRGTLFHDLGDGEWIRSTATSIGREIDVAEADRLSQAITAASSEPEVRAASLRADASVEANRRAVMLLFKTAGLDEELARAVYERDGTPGSCFPYPDAPGVLAGLTARGYRIAIVSDIHFDLRPIFERHNLARFIDAWALSFEHGWVKPEPEPFRTPPAQRTFPQLKRQGRGRRAKLPLRSGAVNRCCRCKGQVLKDRLYRLLRRLV